MGWVEGGGGSGEFCWTCSKEGCKGKGWWDGQASSRQSPPNLYLAQPGFSSQQILLRMPCLQVPKRDNAGFPFLPHVRARDP